MFTFTTKCIVSALGEKYFLWELVGLTITTTYNKSLICILWLVRQQFLSQFDSVSFIQFTNNIIVIWGFNLVGV